MLAADHCLSYDVALRKHELFEIHRSKISLHHTKAGYNYPMIRLPHTFSKLAGLRTRIYQTVHYGALAFLVVVSPTGIPRNASQQSKNDGPCAESPVLTWQRSVRIRPSPLT